MATTLAFPMFLKLIVISGILVTSVATSYKYSRDTGSEQNVEYSPCREGYGHMKLIDCRELWVDAPNGSKVAILEQKLSPRIGIFKGDKILVVLRQSCAPNGSFIEPQLWAFDISLVPFQSQNEYLLDENSNVCGTYEKELNKTIPGYSNYDGILTLRMNFNKSAWADWGWYCLFPQCGNGMDCIYYLYDKSKPVEDGFGSGGYSSSAWTSSDNLLDGAPKPS